MDLTSIVAGIEASALAEWMRNSLKAVPVIEAIHVMAVAVVFGTILIVDLRLVGLPNAQRPVTRIADELLRWTWSAFAVAVVTGLLLFTVNAGTYYDNTAFRWKFAALLAAGINMAVFHHLTYRSVAGWDKDVRPPFAARSAGALSIVIWTSVIFLGRWVGFTKGYDFDIPQDVELDFDFLE
jgi:hypothetical protein